MYKILTLPVLLLAICPFIHAVVDGYELLKDCKQFEKPESAKEQDEAFSLGFCLAYISGVQDTVFAEQGTRKDKGGTFHVCFPAEVILHSQAVRVVIKWLKDNPSQLHLPAVVLVTTAFRRAFPCK